MLQSKAETDCFGRAPCGGAAPRGNKRFDPLEVGHKIDDLEGCKEVGSRDIGQTGAHIVQQSLRASMESSMVRSCGTPAARHVAQGCGVQLGSHTSPLDFETFCKLRVLVTMVTTP